MRLLDNISVAVEDRGSVTSAVVQEGARSAPGDFGRAVQLADPLLLLLHNPQKSSSVATGKIVSERAI